MSRVGIMRCIGAGVVLALACLPIGAGQASTSGLRTVAPAPFVVLAQAGDPCAAIDDAVAAQALGSAVQRTSGPSFPGMCSWRSTARPGDSLTVQVDSGGQDKYDFDRGKLPVHDLDGVGDQAFVFVSPAGFAQLGVMKGGVYVTIVLQASGGGDLLRRATDLAKVIAAGM